MFENYNNGFAGYPTQPQMYENYMGIQPQQMPKRSNYLTDEEMDELIQQRQDFNLALTREEQLKSICNHIDKDGRDMLVQDKDDPEYVVCKRCGQRFKPLLTDAPVEYIKGLSQEYINVLQTIKLMFVDMPTDIARSFFTTIGLAQKTPELFKLAAQNMSKYYVNPYAQQKQSESYMGLLNNFMNGAGGGFGFQQPQYQQPMMGGMGMNNGYAQNPFGYAGAQAQPVYGYGQMQPQYQQQMMGGYQPGTTGYQYTPSATTTPAATPAADDNKTTTTTTTNVQA